MVCRPRKARLPLLCMVAVLEGIRCVWHLKGAREKKILLQFHLILRQVVFPTGSPSPVSSIAGIRKDTHASELQSTLGSIIGFRIFPGPVLARPQCCAVDARATTRWPAMHNLDLLAPLLSLHTTRNEPTRITCHGSLLCLVFSTSWESSSLFAGCMSRSG